MVIVTTQREPGVIAIGEWAHVRYHSRQHLVVANEPEADEAEPIRFACGERYFATAIWHDAPKPHLPHCKRCEKK